MNYLFIIVMNKMHENFADCQIKELCLKLLGQIQKSDSNRKYREERKRMRRGGEGGGEKENSMVYRRAAWENR